MLTNENCYSSKAVRTHPSLEAMLFRVTFCSIQAPAYELVRHLSR